MPRAREELSAGEWAVLAMLSEEPAHGFALARAMAPDGEVGQVWALRRPLVYRALETLEQRGLIRPAGTVASRSGPQRTILEPTPSGSRAVTEWLEAARQPRPRRARSLLMLKLLFLTRREADAPRCSRISAPDSHISRPSVSPPPSRTPTASIAALLIGGCTPRQPRFEFTETMLSETGAGSACPTTRSTTAET